MCNALVTKELRTNLTRNKRHTNSKYSPKGGYKAPLCANQFTYVTFAATRHGRAPLRCGTAHHSTAAGPATPLRAGTAHVGRSGGRAARRSAPGAGGALPPAQPLARRPCPPPSLAPPVPLRSLARRARPPLRGRPRLRSVVCRASAPFRAPVAGVRGAMFHVKHQP